jgi:hypothetical protein
LRYQFRPAVISSSFLPRMSLSFRSMNEYLKATSQAPPPFNRVKVLVRSHPGEVAIGGTVITMLSGEKITSLDVISFKFRIIACIRIQESSEIFSLQRKGAVNQRQVRVDRIRVVDRNEIRVDQSGVRDIGFRI